MNTDELEKRVNDELASMRAVSAETARKMIEKLREYENIMRLAGLREE